MEPRQTVLLISAARKTIQYGKTTNKACKDCHKR
jgi:nitrate/TMAO reductase-like tetraheme cytochrome c subunit